MFDYKLKCQYCKKITECRLSNFDSKKSQRYNITCEHCRKINLKVFPDDLKLEQFYKDLNDREQLFFQKYFLERKSLPKVSKELGVPIATINKVLTKRFKLRSIKEAMKIYWRE